MVTGRPGQSTHAAATQDEDNAAASLLSNLIDVTEAFIFEVPGGSQSTGRSNVSSDPLEALLEGYESRTLADRFLERGDVVTEAVELSFHEELQRHLSQLGLTGLDEVEGNRHNLDLNELSQSTSPAASGGSAASLDDIVGDILDLPASDHHIDQSILSLPDGASSSVATSDLQRIAFSESLPRAAEYSSPESMACEIRTLKRQLQELQRSERALTATDLELRQLRGEKDALQLLTSRQLVSLAETLAKSLLAVQREQQRKVEQLSDEHLCVLCLTDRKNIVLQPCNHLLMCAKCVSKCRGICPQCRATVSSHIKVYT